MASQAFPDTLLRKLKLGPVELITRITTGRSGAGIWRIDASGGHYALRMFKPDERQLCDWEALVMNVAQAGGIPVPAIHLQSEYQGCPYLLLDWLPGQRLAEILAGPAEQIRASAEAFGSMQANIHALKLPAQLRGSQADWINWPEPASPGLTERLHALDLRDDTLLHLDYHPLNVLADGEAISGVLDWSNARIGDARADIARTSTILRFIVPPEPGDLLLNAWWHGYTERAGEPADMLLFNIWAAHAFIADIEPKFDDPAIIMPEDEISQFRTAIQRARDQLKLWE